MARIYGQINQPEDISRINCIIRDEMLVVSRAAELTDLKKRSDYLCTLTFSPFWKKKFGDELEKVREIAIKENRITTKLANYVAAFKGFEKRYQPWKKEIDIEKELKKIPDQIVEELNFSLLDLKIGFQLADDLRRMFCEVRKGVILCEEVECLNKFKRYVDILSVLPFLESFKQHLDREMLAKIDALVNLEKERCVELMNLIVEVKGWEQWFQSVGEQDFASSAEDFLKKLLEEEEKANTYIPTEMKYARGAKVYWLVYYHPKRKREYAKRIYLPVEMYDLQIEGPAEFENRFGNKVYGLRLTYKMRIKATVAKIRGKEVHLPERIVTKTKIVTLPKVAERVRILTERPKSAMDIA